VKGEDKLSERACVHDWYVARIDGEENHYKCALCPRREMLRVPKNISPDRQPEQEAGDTWESMTILGWEITRERRWKVIKIPLYKRIWWRVLGLWDNLQGGVEEPSEKPARVSES
jgi:hypothetical protein